MKLVPENSSVLAFYFCATSYGIEKVKEKLMPLANERSINFEIFRWKVIENQIFSRCETQYSWHDTKTYFQNHKCLWPNKNVSNEDAVIQYISTFDSLTSEPRKIYYRHQKWINDAGIFYSVANRDVVEKEFLLKGIEIYKCCSKDSKLYPFGKGVPSTFGTGIFCAFEDNISNTCPLVLWWGNLNKDGSVLNNWYPLLPRRVQTKKE